MPLGARTIVVDGRLIEADGWAWEGDLRIVTPDTAPYSTALHRYRDYEAVNRTAVIRPLW